MTLPLTMAVVAQLGFVLCCLVSISGSSEVVRSVGDSVQLDMQHPVPKFDDLNWIFNGTDTVIKYYIEDKITKVYAAYKDRVEFNNRTYSLTLKNLQWTDSGLYEASASGEKVRAVAEYRLSVLGPSPPDDGRLSDWLFLVLLVVFIILAVIVIIFISLYAHRRRSTGLIQCENSIYAELEASAGATSPNAKTHSTLYGAVTKKPHPPSDAQPSRTKPEQWSTSGEPSVFTIYETLPDQMEHRKSQTIYATASKPL